MVRLETLNITPPNILFLRHCTFHITLGVHFVIIKELRGAHINYLQTGRTDADPSFDIIVSSSWFGSETFFF